MIAFYLQIKAVHVAAIVASGGFFALRGAAALVGQRWPYATPVRWLAWTIDTVLLTAALMLLTALKLNPVVVPWLSTKLLLLVAYIVLGAFAMHRGPSPPSRRLCYVGALACYGAIYSIARTHHPLGALSYFGV